MKNVGPQNGDFVRECLEGQTWTQVEGNVAFDWSISGYPSLCVFVWLGVDYTFKALICLSVMHVWLLLFIGDVYMLNISIDSLTCFCIVTLLVVWLSCFPWHVYSYFCISHSSWHHWFSLLYIILFVSTYCPFYYILILFILSLPSLCVDMSELPVLCMTTPLLCDCMLLIYVGHTSIPLPPIP